MKERQLIFETCLNAYKELDINTQKQEFIKSLKTFIVILDQIVKLENIPIEYIRSNEVLDIKKDNFTESDFLEAAFVYLEIIKDIVGQYLLKKDN